ncbi:MAG: GSCFA domain-containing protein [Cyclobacteriaceae bacterium]
MDKTSEGFRFRTEIGKSASCLDLTYSSTFFAIGSCFAENTGTILQERKFIASVNPFGTIYDPLSIHRLIKYAVENNTPDPSGFVERDGLFFCDEIHSSVHAGSREALNIKINELVAEVHRQIIITDVFLVTYGTAFIYSRMDSGKSVANCHKLPGGLFEKKLLSVEEIITSFLEVHSLIRKINPASRFILTVSPVRHLKDTLELNVVSKAVLRLAVHKLKELPGVFYFPAFEIMNDDLRDYRFYAADMIHPSDQAIDYIWSHLRLCLFEPETLDLMARVEKLNRSLNHRPFNPESSSHKKFLKSLEQEILELNPIIDLSRELSEVKALLKNSE